MDLYIDAFLILYEECLQNSRKDKTFKSFTEQFHDFVHEARKGRETIDEYERLKVIGKGAFGTVYLAKHKKSDVLVALKSMSKNEVLKRIEATFFREERDLLVKAVNENSPWITKLWSAFQDEDFLYFVMEFYPGGDLLSYLNRHETLESITEDNARFYMCEILVALQCVHNMGYAHRDIKPDNVLIASDGHIKLADFGSCISMNSSGQIHSKIAVGTPDYISPEILKSIENNSPYDASCDFWSLGVLLYEMLYGETPFYSESIAETYHRIQNIVFDFPEEPERSEDAKDLIKRWCSDKENRLCSFSAIKTHRFFNGVDWTIVERRSLIPPFVPELEGDTDLSLFDSSDDVTSPEEAISIFGSTAKLNSDSVLRQQIPFIGFTFSGERPKPYLQNLLEQKSIKSSENLRSIIAVPTIDKTNEATIEVPENIEAIQNDMKVDLLVEFSKRASENSLDTLIEPPAALPDSEIHSLEEIRKIASIEGATYSKPDIKNDDSVAKAESKSHETSESSKDNTQSLGGNISRSLVDLMNNATAIPENLDHICEPLISSTVQFNEVQKEPELASDISPGNVSETSNSASPTTTARKSLVAKATLKVKTLKSSVITRAKSKVMENSRNRIVEITKDDLMVKSGPSPNSMQRLESHNFTNSFQAKGPQICSHCNLVLKGRLSSAVQCKDCSQKYHSSCVSLLAPGSVCSKTKKEVYESPGQFKVDKVNQSNYETVLMQGPLKFSVKASSDTFGSNTKKVWAILEGRNILLYESLSNNTFETFASYCFDLASPGLEAIAEVTSDPSGLGFFKKGYEFAFSLSYKPNNVLLFTSISKAETSNWLWILNSVRRHYRQKEESSISMASMKELSSIYDISFKYKITSHSQIVPGILAVACVDGLYKVSTSSRTKTNLTNSRKIDRIFVDNSKRYVICITGKNRSLEIFNIKESDSFKVQEFSGCKFVTEGVLSGSPIFLVSLISKKVISFSILPGSTVQIVKEFQNPEVALAICANETIKFVFETYLRILDQDGNFIKDLSISPRHCTIAQNLIVAIFQVSPDLDLICLDDVGLSLNHNSGECKCEFSWIGKPLKFAFDSKSKLLFVICKAFVEIISLPSGNRVCCIDIMKFESFDDQSLTLLSESSYSKIQIESPHLEVGSLQSSDTNLEKCRSSLLLSEVKDLSNKIFPRSAENLSERTSVNSSLRER